MSQADECRKAELNFIAANWGRFATYAWHEFSRHGRGMLLLDIADANIVMGGAMTEVEMSYSVDIEHFAPEAKALVLKYDPNIEVVFCCRRVDRTLKYYRLGAEPSPPEAYESRGGRFK